MVSGGTRQGGVATDGGNPGGGCRCNTNHRQGATTDGGNLVTRLMFAPDDELWFRLRVWHGNEGARCVPWWQTRQRFGRISILLLPREWSCGQSVVRSTPPCWRSAMIEASARWGSSRAQRVPRTRHPWGCGGVWGGGGVVRRGGGGEEGVWVGLREVVEVALRQSTRWRSTGAEPDPLSESEWVALAARLQPVSLPRA